MRNISVKDDTEFSSEELEYVFTKYCGYGEYYLYYYHINLLVYLGTVIPDPKTLYQVYCYLHLYANCSHSKTTISCTHWVLQYKVIPALHHLSVVMHEIIWDDCLSLFNHTPHFPFLFTGIVDTFLLCVKKPTNSTLHQALYNPKYEQCVYKA